MKKLILLTILLIGCSDPRIDDSQPMIIKTKDISYMDRFKFKYTIKFIHLNGGIDQPERGIFYIYSNKNKNVGDTITF